MEKRNGWVLRPAAVGLLMLAGCQHIPYYDESLNWFSWSDYDPEIEAIEAQTSPPGALEAPAPAADRGAFVGDSAGGHVWTAPPPNGVVALGATPFAARGSAASAAGSVAVVDTSANGPPDPGSPLVGIRNSIGASVTSRSVRGTP
jgi:hypothetical protein